MISSLNKSVPKQKPQTLSVHCIVKYRTLFLIYRPVFISIPNVKKFTKRFEYARHFLNCDIHTTQNENNTYAYK